MDFHSIGRFTEDDLKKSQKEPREVLNKFETKYNRITRVKMTSKYAGSGYTDTQFLGGDARETKTVDTQLY